MEIEHWFSSLRHRARLFLAVVLGSLVLGLLLAVVQQPVYKATAEVVLGQSAGATLLGTATTTPDLTAELKTAQSDAVVQAADKDRDNPGEVVVTADQASLTLIFEATGSSGQEAADLANAHANAYISVRQDRTEAEYQAALSRLRDKVAAIDDQIAALPAAGSDDERATLQAQRAAYRTAFDQLEVASVVGGTSAARILTPAEVPSQKSSPLLRNYLVFALLGGLFLGAGAVGIAEFMDRSVKDAESARTAAGGVPVLGRIERTRRARFRSGRPVGASRGSAAPTPAEAPTSSTLAPTGVALLDAPASAESEVYRSLRTTVSSMIDIARPFLQITSALRDDRAGEVAASLATSLALTGQPTVLVCLGELDGIHFPLQELDTREPLTAFLTGSALTTDCMAAVDGVEHLSVIVGAAGEVPDDVARRSIGDALKQLHSLGRTVIVLAPPVLSSAVALEVADLVDGTIVVVQERSTRAADLEQSCRSLALMDSPLLGVVLT